MPLTFTISQHESLCLSGPSGCGKSSLLRAALGFSESFTGNIHLNEENIHPATLKHLHSVSGYLPQRPDLGTGTLKQIIQDLLTEELQHRLTTDLLPRLGISAELLGHPAERLSGGERQRIGLAIVLTRRPQFLVLDEPSSGLDRKSRTALIKLLQEHETACLYSSHDLDFIREINCTEIQVPCRKAAL
ncbi:hypothetical protein JCM12856_02960 [Spirochaeta dissipatitropha]